MTSIWTPEADAELVRLWMQPSPRLSLTDIAILMRVSKNAIAGRAHRLAAKGLLVMRESPIRPVAVSAGAVADRRVSQAVSRSNKLLLRAPRSHAFPPAAPPPASAPVVRAPSPHRACQWIEGEAAGVDSLFCRAVTVRGSSYCAAHHARCHTTRPKWAA